jgi:hypothetical protein
MPNYYSDLFQGTKNTLLDRGKRANAGIGHGRLRYKRAEFTRSLVDGDFVRMMQFKSGDRLSRLYRTNGDSGDNGAITIGLFKTGYAHDGAVIQADLISGGSSPTSVASAGAHVKTFGTAGSIVHIKTYAGKALWQFADADASTYTVDPMEDWDLVVECTTTFDSSIQFILEAYYTSGD